MLVVNDVQRDTDLGLDERDIVDRMMKLLFFDKASASFWEDEQMIHETLDKMVHHKVGVVVRLLRSLLLSHPLKRFASISDSEARQLEAIEAAAARIYYKKQGEFLAAGQTKRRGVSKEHIAVRELLQKILPDPTELKWEISVDGLFENDFYIPSKNAVIEINGDLHFYPYTTKFSNVFRLKHNVLRL